MKEFIWNGPVLAPVFVPSNQYKLAGDFLSPLAEEMLIQWSILDEKYSKDKTYIKNFYSDLKYELTKNQFKLKFPEDFSEILSRMKTSHQQFKEDKAAYEKEHKEEIKEKKERIKKEFGTCIIDGKEVSIQYAVEPPSIFRGRGNNPLSGHWKYRVEYSDIRLNRKEPKKEGELYGSVEWLPDVAFGGTYNQKIGHNADFINIKSFLFSANQADVTIQRNIEKFNNARKMIEMWEEIKSHIFKGIFSSDETRMQTALVLYLVQNLGIRIGNEKDTDVSADTVGASTLKVSSMKIDKDKLILDFIGKDSIKDHRELVIYNTCILEAFNKCLSNKSKNDLIFEKTNSGKTEEFLREVIPEATNKLFRTAYGSGLLANEIRNKEWNNLSDKEFKLQFDECTLEVAKKLNHHSTIEKSKQKENDRKNKEKIKIAKENLECTKQKISLRIEVLSNHLSKCKDKEKKKILEEKINSYKEKQLVAIKRFTDLKNSLNFKIGVGDIALGTSRANYSTPELAFSLCNYTGKDPSLIYTKTLLEKFEWAKNADKNLWKEYPSIS